MDNFFFTFFFHFFFSFKVSTAQSTQPRTHAAGVRKVSDKHSAQMQKAEATVHENSVKSLLLFVLHKRKKKSPSTTCRSSRLYNPSFKH